MCIYSFKLFGDFGPVYNYDFLIYECPRGSSAVEIAPDTDLYICFGSPDYEGLVVPPDTETLPPPVALPTETEKVLCPSDHEARNYLYSSM